MSKKYFNEDEIKILKANKYTYYVSTTQIRFTKEFKELFYEEFKAGKNPNDIVEKLGYDLKILGPRRPGSIAFHIREEYEKHSSFHTGRLDSIKPVEDITDEDISTSAKLFKLQAKVKYLEQQVEFLKKILQENK